MPVMKIVMAGGGSGGHVTPLKAVIQALQQQLKATELEVTVVTDKKFLNQSQQIFADQKVDLRVISAGKLRRYHGKGWWWHITHLPTIMSNLADLARIGWGSLQAIILLRRLRPQVIFCKGGYVCVPVGFAARLLKIPLLIHDSDTHPGLTNRMLAGWAQSIATGMPSKYYRYPVEKMTYTGIPVDQKLDTAKTSSATFKKQAGFNSSDQVMLITGGSTGAERLNKIMTSVIPELLDQLPNLEIIHITGTNKAHPVKFVQSKLTKEQKQRWQIHEFVPLVPYILAADLVVTRTGASAMQEFANAHKAVITVPSPYLTGGHQLKNAAMFKEKQSVEVVDELKAQDNPTEIASLIKALLGDTEHRNQLATNLQHNFAKPNAARELAELILQLAQKA